MQLRSPSLISKDARDYIPRPIQISKVIELAAKAKEVYIISLEFVNDLFIHTTCRTQLGPSAADHRGDAHCNI